MDVNEFERGDSFPQSVGFRRSRREGEEGQPTRRLAYVELREIIGLSLWAGQMLLQNGASSLRTEETTHRIGTGLGCDWMDVIVTPDSLIVTATDGEDFRTKARRVVRLGANMGRITALSELGHAVAEGRADRAQVQARLRAIDAAPKDYNRWLVVFLVGLACAAFSRLFGGDWPVFGVTLVAASVAMFTRQELEKRYFNRYLVVATVAFIGGLLASGARLVTDAANVNIAIAATALLLVPGVPLINSAQDFIRGYTGNGLRRGMSGLLISLAIALGLALAIQFAQVLTP